MAASFKKTNKLHGSNNNTLWNSQPKSTTRASDTPQNNQVKVAPKPEQVANFFAAQKEYHEKRADFFANKDPEQSTPLLNALLGSIQQYENQKVNVAYPRPEQFKAPSLPNLQNLEPLDTLEINLNL